MSEKMDIICCLCGTPNQRAYLEPYHSIMEQNKLCFNCYHWWGNWLNDRGQSIPEDPDTSYKRNSAFVMVWECEGERMHGYGDPRWVGGPGDMRVVFSGARLTFFGKVWHHGIVPKHLHGFFPVNCRMATKEDFDLIPHKDDRLPLGTRVKMRPWDDTALIIGYNVSRGFFYPPSRYPYIVQYENTTVADVDRWCVEKDIISVTRQLDTNELFEEVYGPDSFLEVYPS